MLWRTLFVSVLLTLACICDAYTRAGVTRGKTTNSVADHQVRIMRSPLDSPGDYGNIITGGTAYFTYVGTTNQPITPAFVEIYVSTGGAGAQTAEVGLFSTPLPPNKAGQTLTKLVATGTVSDLTTAGIDRNSSAFTTEIAAGTHLWAGFRIDMAVTEPVIRFIAMDMSQGWVLQTAAAASFTGAGPWTGSLVALSTGSQHPDIRVTLD